MAAHDAEVEDLWEQFHGIVNMSAPELQDWLGSAVVPKPSDGRQRVAPLGVAVTRILAKRKTDLTADDLAVIRRVIEVYTQEARSLSPEDLATNERARHRLMTIGHDPMKSRREGAAD